MKPVSYLRSIKNHNILMQLDLTQGCCLVGLHLAFGSILINILLPLFTGKASYRLELVEHKHVHIFPHNAPDNIFPYNIPDYHFC